MDRCQSRRCCLRCGTGLGYVTSDLNPKMVLSLMAHTAENIVQGHIEDEPRASSNCLNSSTHMQAVVPSHALLTGDAACFPPGV